KDVINPIPQPGGQYIDVYFPHHDWEDIPFGSADLTQDIHKFFNIDEADADYEKKWKVVVESNVSFSNVELSFDLSNQLSPLEFARVFIDRNGVYTELFTNGSNEFIFILDNFTGYEEFNIVVSKPEAAVRIIYPNGGDIIDRSANSLIVELKYVMVDFIQRLQLYYEIEGNSYFLGDYSPENEVVVSIADSLDSDGFIEEIMDDVVLVARIIDKNGENDALHHTYKDVSDNPFIIAKNQIQLFDDQFGWHLATPPLGSESGNHSISSIFNTVPENILSYDTGAGNLSYASSQIAADEGFYLFNDVPMTGFFSGIVNTGPHTITVNTGWNLIGNPLVSEVTIDSVLVNGEYWYDAAANGSIAPTPIIFDNATATHKGTDYLEMGTGFWIYAYSDGTEISFPPHLQNIEDSGEHSDGWLITLNAREANLSPDNFAYSIGSEVKIGVHESAWDIFEEGEDQESIPFGNP
ncbi:MAG: hypothetical protein QGF57_02480, partial [Candidatus Marinimicrobia bacterium]|nr:hypothetical protein [Candidatus Neomarinimicrobiota bacterium]